MSMSREIVLAESLVWIVDSTRPVTVARTAISTVS